MTKPWRECLNCGQIFHPVRADTDAKACCSRSCARRFENRVRALDDSAMDKLMLALRADFRRILGKGERK